MEQRDPDRKPALAGEPREREESKKPGEYLRAVRAQLLEGRTKEAYAVLLKAVAKNPDDPLLLSYYGRLQAVVDKKFRSGIAACTRAILLLKKKEYFSEEVLYPVLYQNLGRAYLEAGRKKDAIAAFKKGLRYDTVNSELLAELRSLGVRKKPPVPFLERSHPINRIIGRMLHRKGSKPR